MSNIYQNSFYEEYNQTCLYFSSQLIRDLKLKIPTTLSTAKIGDNMFLLDDELKILPEGGPNVIRSAAGSSNTLFIEK